MKYIISKISIVGAFLILALASCTKKTTTTTTTPTPTTGKFTAIIGDADNFSAPDAYIMPAFGGTIAVMAKDATGRTFQLAIFEKDFPVNKAISVAFSPSISYANEKSETYIAKEGTMTITEYGKNSSGTVTNLKGNFAVTLTKDGRDLIVKNGMFDVSTK